MIPYWESEVRWGGVGWGEIVRLRGEITCKSLFPKLYLDMFLIGLFVYFVDWLCIGFVGLAKLHNGTVGSPWHLHFLTRQSSFLERKVHRIYY